MSTYLTSDQQADVDELNEDERNEYYNLRSIDLDHSEARDAAVLIWSKRTPGARTEANQFFLMCLRAMSAEEAVEALRRVR